MAVIIIPPQKITPSMRTYLLPVTSPFVAKVALEVWVAFRSSLLHKLHEVQYITRIVNQYNETEDRSKSEASNECKWERLALSAGDTEMSTGFVYVPLHKRLHENPRQEERLRDDDDEARKERDRKN